MLLSKLVPFSQILLLALSSPSHVNVNAFQLNKSRQPYTSAFFTSTTNAHAAITTRTTNTATKPSTTVSSSSSTSLFSLNKLIEELNTSASSGKKRTVFVGGKGGVGKTTVSSSIAVTLASDYTSDLKVLVVSTDPAHSLGDALDVDLKSSHGKKLQMTDPLTGGKLYAMEVDTDAALEKFQNALGTFDVAKLSQALGVQPELLEGLGLGELSSMIKNPPPGLDELVALSNILNDPEIAREFDVVVVDTAPTGQTRRMLALPEFLDVFWGTLLE
jgi:arsenite-transporting ATPase